MQCPQCLHDNRAGAKFCEECAAPFARACASCGQTLAPEQLSCPRCAHPTGSAVSSPPASTASTASHPPKHLAEGIASARIAPEGERKQVTVLFADIVGSTQLIASLDPEQAMERLRPAVAAMCKPVQRFDGTIVQTLGDGIMALFGAPRAQEGHALLACEAALAMQEAFQAGEGGLRIRIGLHAGEVVSGVLDTDPTGVERAHGVTVHLASRLQQLAEPGGICLTEDCYRLVRRYCDADSLGRLPVKGFPEPIEVYRLLRLRPAVASRQFRGTSLAHFRGRDRELAMLQRALRSTENGQARVVGVSGPPGQGKSRLCYEFVQWCRSRGIPVLEARAQAYGHATPLQPVLELFRLYFGFSPADDDAIARGRIAERLTALDPALASDLPLLYDFLGVADGNSPAPFDPKTRNARLLHVVRRIVGQAGTTTSVILVEDLHWLDEASEDFVGTLVDAVEETRTMLVLNFRPSYVASWMKRSHYRELPLPELDAADIKALTQELIGSRPELSAIRDRVAERSGGNPFFAEELVRALAQSLVLVGEASDYSLGVEREEGTLPATVQAVIGARIDLLDEPEKILLQIGAIIGKEFPLVVLQQIAGRPAGEVATALDRLCQAELIQAQSGSEARQFSFRHPLIQEVAYATQLRSRRGALHASVARALEEYHKGRLDEFAGLLAYHYEAAGQPIEAARYSARAASWVGTTDSSQAIKHWQKVRLLLQHQPRLEAYDRLRIMASGQIATLGWREGMTVEEVKPYLSEALGWARESDNSMVQLLLAAEGRLTVASGGAADIYVDRIKEAISLLGGGDNAGRAATLNALLSHACGLAGMLNDALAANDDALQQVSAIEEADQRFLGFNIEQWVLSQRGRILLPLGRLAEAQECFDILLRNEPMLVDPAIHFIPHSGYVELAWLRGDAALAEQHAGRIGEIAENSKLPYLRVYALARSGQAKSIANDLTGAMQDFNDGLEFAQKTKAALELEPEIRASLADCHYRAGNFEQAARIAMEAMEVARLRNARLAECRACITRGAALVAEDEAMQRAEAEAVFDHAEVLIRTTGAIVFEPLLARERARLPASEQTSICGRVE